MASTYISLFAHIVFATKNRSPIIDKSWQNDLHAYLGGITRTHGGTAVMVGGVEDHIHMLLGYKATHCLADLVREIKKGSSAWAANMNPNFAWQTGSRVSRVTLPIKKSITERCRRLMNFA